MPASEAQVRANRENSAKSTGPKSVEGKERSRANSYQHGMTGAGDVVPVEESAEVERRVLAFRAELHPSGELGLALVRRAAILSVRMEKCAERELTATAERVARAMAEFEVPDGVDAAEATRLRTEAGRIAAFDPSKEAGLARRYEAAAERGFYRALKEFRQVEKSANAHQPVAPVDQLGDVLGSFGEMTQRAEPLNPPRPQTASTTVSRPFQAVAPSPWDTFGGRVDVPLTIGRAR